MVGQQRQPLDPAARSGNRRLAAQHAAVGELRHQRDELARGGQHDAARANHARRDLDGLCEVVRDVSQRRQHEISDRVAVQTVAGTEPILKDVGDL